MSLSFGLSPWLLALCLTAAAALTYWTYRRTLPRVSTARRALLIGLRFVALFLLLFLLFEPVWRRFEREERPPVLAVLVDDSQSMGLTAQTEGDALDLAAATRRTLQALPLKDLNGRTRLYAFSNAVRPLSQDDGAAADSLRFDGARTNIAQALDYVRETLQDQNLRGVLLISDGQFNTGRNPIYQAERYPVPIYTVAVGDTLRRRDLQIRRVTTNEIAYVGAQLPVQVGLRADGFGGEQVIVSLVRGGEVLASAPVVLPEGTAEVPVDLSFTPKQEGFQQLNVSVTRLPGETTYRNNEESLTLRVLKSKRRVLLVGAAPGPDLAAVRQLLEDADTDVVSFVQKGPGTFYEGAFPSRLGDVDLMVLVGFPGRGADRNVMRAVAAAALDGKPLLFLLTRQTDLDAVADNFEDVLPALPERNRPGFAEASIVLTPRGEQHPILEIPQRPASFGGLPPLLYNQSRWQASPDARVLATIEMRGVQLDDPLLVIRRRAGSRSAALLGAGTWRWKNLPDDLDAYMPFWPGLFSNLVQWLTTPEDDRRVRVEPVEALFSGGEPIQFTGQVYDESLNPVSDASVSLEISAPDSTKYPYLMESVGNGRYVLDVGTLPEGTYAYRAAADRNEITLGTDNGSFAVGSLTLEFKETRANAALLRQIARRSGGAFFTPDQVQRLPAALDASDTFKPVRFEQASETELWHLPVFILFVLSLLTTEWVVRKRSGMV